MPDIVKKIKNSNTPSAKKNTNSFFLSIAGVIVFVALLDMILSNAHAVKTLWWFWKSTTITNVFL